MPEGVPVSDSFTKLVKVDIDRAALAQMAVDGEEEGDVAA